MQAIRITETPKSITIRINRTLTDQKTVAKFLTLAGEQSNGGNALTAAGELRRLPQAEKDAILMQQTAIALQDFEVIGDCPELDESGNL